MHQLNFSFTSISLSFLIFFNSNGSDEKSYCNTFKKAKILVEEVGCATLASIYTTIQDNKLLALKTVVENFMLPYSPLSAILNDPGIKVLSHVTSPLAIYLDSKNVDSKNGALPYNIKMGYNVGIRSIQILNDITNTEKISHCINTTFPNITILLKKNSLFNSAQIFICGFYKVLSSYPDLVTLFVDYCYHFRKYISTL